MKNKKGFVFTIDSVLALLTALALIGAVLFLMRQPALHFNEQSLEGFAKAALAVLEKDGTLKAAVETNSSSAIGAYLNSYPQHLCASVSIKNTNKNIVLPSINKINCSSSSNKLYTRRVFIANSSTYYAEMNSWYNE